MTDAVTVRDATEADLPAITHLFNVWVPTRTIAWTDTPWSLDDRTEWFRQRQADGFPVLVADDGGAVVGFTTYGHFRGVGMSGYSKVAELTIHVNESHWGQGVGRALMDALVERARAAGMHVLVAGIDGENEESMRFHARLGFVEVARMPQTGHKFGRWLDLVLMQRILDDRPRP